MSVRGTVILGIGNPLMSDDGVGIHAVRDILANPSRTPGARCLDGGTLGYLLVGHIKQVDDLIVIDAAQLGDRPGTVCVFENEEMDAFLGSHPNRSVHEVGLGDLMTMSALSGHLPKRRALIAVQPMDTDWGTELSPPLMESLPVVCEKAAELMEKWRS